MTKIKVQLKSAGTEEHTCEHYEVKDNGALYIYRRWQRHEYGALFTIDTIYASGFWQCVIGVE